MSYYRYITGVYKSYWPGLNRTLRSSSVPRSVPSVPDIDCGTYGLNVSGLEGGLRMRRSTSLPPTNDFTSSSFLTRHSATPFRDRAASVPPQIPFAFKSVNRSSVSRLESTHYTDFDCKVMDYMGQLDRQQDLRNLVSHSRIKRESSPGRFSSRYDFYDGNKHCEDYLYTSSRDVLGSWMVTGKSRETLRNRNDRAQSPLVSRGLDRYFGGRVDYLGDVSSGRSDFRHYNYRKVPYLGQSDYMKYIPKYFDYLNEIPNQRFKYGSDFE